MPKVSLPIAGLRPPPPRLVPKIITPTEFVSSSNVGGFFAKGYVLFWPDLGKLIPSLLVKYRLVDGNGPGRSVWSPPTEFPYTFFDIYRRKVSSPYNPGEAFSPWEKMETVSDYRSSELVADWTGKVQYAVCLSHPESKPAPSEGMAAVSATNQLVADLTTIYNPYLLFITNTLATVVV
jgi:hypothetical protein